MNVKTMLLLFMIVVVNIGYAQDQEKKVYTVESYDNGVMKLENEDKTYSIKGDCVLTKGNEIMMVEGSGSIRPGIFNITTGDRCDLESNGNGEKSE